MPSHARKDAIAKYLFQKFIQGNDCPSPRKIVVEPVMALFAQKHLNQNDFQHKSEPSQKEALSVGVGLLMTTLGVAGFKDKSLLDELTPKLEEVLKGESETLRPFLEILIQRGAYPDPDLEPPSPVLGHPIEKVDSEYAWQQEYQGKAHELLLQNIQKSFIPDTAYSNSGAIIQSSGYGKSRTVDQMATLIPTIPMNLRADAEAMQGAFPPADATLVDIFISLARLPNTLASIFLLFEKLFELVRDLAKNLSRANFALDLYLLLNNRDTRAKLYTDLAAKLSQHTSKDVTKEDAQEAALKSYWKLAELFPQSEGLVKMVLYIDEAHTLASMTVSGASTNMYEQVLTATAELATTRIFFLVLSTASRAEVLAGQPMLSNSARFRAADHLVAPFTEMPFDCHPSLMKGTIRPGMKLEEIQKFPFAVRFGRPLFWAYYEAMTKRMGEQAARLETFGMAQGKLIASASLSDLGDAGKVAILDTLLNLEYDPQRTHSHRLASTMVASHLRTVYSVPTNRAYMHTGYPSEPILAEAALTIIHYHMPKTTGVGPLASLYRDVDKHAAGAIDKGERGENVGKMILLEAYVAAVKKGRVSPPLAEVSWGDGCSLVDFLAELTGDTFCEDLLVSVPDNLKDGATLKDAFKDSWVRFTHFARAADDSIMTSSMACVAFIRGMAMIGWRSLKDVDVSIPILLDRSKPISEANMSSILVQFKVCSARTKENMVAIHQEAIKYFPRPGTRRDASAKLGTSVDVKAYFTRPYISLVMELGLVASSSSGIIPSKVVERLDYAGIQRQEQSLVTNPPVIDVYASKPKLTRTQPPRPKKAQQTSPAYIHPRYSLFYYGCSHQVYQCIPDTTEAQAAYRTLLQIPTVFNDRPENRLIDPVLQMKPFWSAGSNCFSWIDEPYFTPTDEESMPEDVTSHEVLIGEPIEVDNPDEVLIEVDTSNFSASELGQESERMDESH